MHPNIDFFLSTYKKVPFLSISELSILYKDIFKFPEYILLSSFIARVISNKSEDLNESLLWNKNSLDLLSTNNKKDIYGSNDDYLLSVQESLISKLKLLSESDNPSHWHQGITIGNDLYQTKYSYIISKKDSKFGTSVISSLIILYTRLHEYDKAIKLAEKLQNKAQEFNLIDIELKSIILWSIALILLSKVHRIEDKINDFEAVTKSVLNVLNSMTMSDNRFKNIAGAFIDYTNFLINADIKSFKEKISHWSEDQIYMSMDLISEHSNELDEELIKYIENDS